MTVDIDTRNREIADALTAQGFPESLAWERTPGYRCADGHSQLWARADGQCWVKNCQQPMEPNPRVPHDFTNAEFLLPAVEAWCDHVNAYWTWQRVAMALPGQEYAAHIMTVTPTPEVKEWGAFGTTPTEALWQAFAAALAEGVQA